MMKMLNRTESKIHPNIISMTFAKHCWHGFTLFCFTSSTQTWLDCFFFFFLYAKMILLSYVTPSEWESYRNKDPALPFIQILYMKKYSMRKFKISNRIHILYIHSIYIHTCPVSTLLVTILFSHGNTEDASRRLRAPLLIFLLRAGMLKLFLTFSLIKIILMLENTTLDFLILW